VTISFDNSFFSCRLALVSRNWAVGKGYDWMSCQNNRWYCWCQRHRPNSSGSRRYEGGSLSCLFCCVWIHRLSGRGRALACEWWGRLVVSVTCGLFVFAARPFRCLFCWLCFLVHRQIHCGLFFSLIVLICLYLHQLY